MCTRCNYLDFNFGLPIAAPVEFVSAICVCARADDSPCNPTNLSVQCSNCAFFGALKTQYRQHEEISGVTPRTAPRIYAFVINALMEAILTLKLDCII